MCSELLETRRLLSFAPAVNYDTIGTPSAIVTADFNNDGKLDLVTCAQADTGSFSVFLGNGAGGFGAAQRTILSTQLSSLAAADFNHDGKVDLVISDSYDYGFNFLAGKGDGTFQPPVLTQGGAVSAVGRFNGDSYTDVLVARLGPDWETQLLVYCGDGQGGFTAADLGIWYYGTESAAVDLDHDGKLDVVTAEGYVFPGNGDGTFQFDWEQPAVLNGGVISTGDFNGDSKADAIVAGTGGSADNVSVLRGTGDGGFAPPVHHAAYGTYHTAVATADFDADGKLDAIVTDYDLGTVSVMLGNGDGTLRFFGAFATAGSPSDVAVGDYNRDGRLDVAVSNTGTRNVSVLLNDGNWQTPPPPPPVVYVSIGDVTVTEGDAATRTVTFTVTLSQPATAYSEVYYNTADITALAGSDYNATSGLVPFAAGETTKTIPMTIRGDTVAEPTETFSVNLVQPTNLRIADGQAIGTILDDDDAAPPTKTFTGSGGNGSGGNWSNGGNWTPSGVPGASDVVSIGSGKTVNLSGSATVAGLSLADGATLNISSNGNRVLRTTSLNISGTSKLNLNDNDLILNYSGGASPMADVFSKLAAGRASTPSGIFSSAANASDGMYSLGVAEAKDVLGLGGAATATFSGQTVDATCVLVKFTYGGDANLDGIISSDDYAAIDFNVAVAGASGWWNGDFNYDGIISGDDYAIIDFNIAAQSGPLQLNTQVQVVAAPASRAFRRGEAGVATKETLASSAIRGEDGRVVLRILGVDADAADAGTDAA
jgi:hypothetical protein